MPAPEDNFIQDQQLATELIQLGLVEKNDAETAIEYAKNGKKRLFEAFLKLGLVEEEALSPVFCDLLKVPFIEGVSDVQVNDKALENLTKEYASANQIVPIVAFDGKLQLVMAVPSNETLAKEVAFLLGQQLTPVGATSSTIRRLLARDSENIQKQPAAHREAPENETADGPVIRFVQQTLSEAVVQGASDIHFESNNAGLEIRYRLNGILVPQPTDISLEPDAIIARLKVISGVNVAEKRLPQDGRIQTTLAGRKIDFRLSSIPTVLGESIVCRVLDPKALKLGWDKLGFDASVAQSIQDIISSPNGLFLVTGPTGSGKTTTLYTAIAHLNTRRRKIITVEDPVEYDLPGVQQMQVKEEIGMSFAQALRAILRHDPNVIMVGEIRDAETAQIACRAAQVGRLVLSTLHTNSADGAFTRLIDLGVPEFIVRSVLHGVLAQDLKTKECSVCSGQGCQNCEGTGVVGRELITELKQYTVI